MVNADPLSVACESCGASVSESCSFPPGLPNGLYHRVRGDAARNQPLVQNETATHLIVEHRFEWCRAKLLHALAGAMEQGVLDEVIDELLDGDAVEDAVTVDEDRTVNRLKRALSRTRWVK